MEENVKLHVQSEFQAIAFVSLLYIHYTHFPQCKVSIFIASTVG